jgi:hypothetical protein
MKDKYAISEITNEWGYTTNNSNDAASAIHRVIREAKDFLSDSETKAIEEADALAKRKLEIKAVIAELDKLDDEYTKSGVEPITGSDAYEKALDMVNFLRSQRGLEPLEDVPTY